MSVWYDCYGRYMVYVYHFEITFIAVAGVYMTNMVGVRVLCI